MRLAFAAVLALLLAVPAFAGSTTTIGVGLVVTGRLASPLAGTWQARSTERGGIYHFVVGGGSGAFYELVSVPLRGRACDLRVSGVIYSLEPTSTKSSYEMQYAIQAADVVASSTSSGCRDVAASYLSEAESVRSMILSRTGDGRLINRATGAEYLRTR